MMILFVVAVVVCATATAYLFISAQCLPTPPRNKVFAGMTCSIVGFIFAIYCLQYLNVMRLIIGIVIGLSISTAILLIAATFQSRKDSEDEADEYDD